jgi:hypothetical protein
VGATAVIAASFRKEREVRDAFSAAGATTPVNAMSLEAIGIEETMAVRRLKKRAVIREAAPGLFYFDLDVYQAQSSMRRRMALFMLGTIVLALLVVFGYGKAVMK